MRILFNYVFPDNHYNNHPVTCQKLIPCSIFVATNQESSAMSRDLRCNQSKVEHDVT
jgi:hypothetical protein